MATITRTIPTRDRAFAALVDQAMASGGFASPEALEAHLRRLLPRVVVRDRGLAGEGSIWYVYRDGRWQDDASDPWWRRERVPTLTASLHGWLVTADPMARSILGIGHAGKDRRHLTEFVAPGTLEDAEALFAAVAAGHPFVGTVVVDPIGGDLIAAEIHAERQGKRIIAAMRLASDVDVPEAAPAAPPRLTTMPPTDVVFGEYVAAILGRMGRPTPDALALRLRRLYPHAHVDAVDGSWTVHRDRGTVDVGADHWWEDGALPAVVYDDNGLILDANGAAAELFGHRMVGEHWHDFITPGTSDEVERVIGMIREAGVAVSRFRMPSADGSLVEFDSYTEWDGALFRTVIRPLAGEAEGMLA